MLMDTHIFLWFQFGVGKLTHSEIKSIEKSQQAGELCISAISLWEIALKEKSKGVALYQPLDTWLSDALIGIKVINIDTPIALESIRLPDFEHKDPADRFILATARVLNISLMTHDQKIIAYAKQAHFRLAS